MLDYASRRLTDRGYIPYYLYRQTRMVGNLENTGWSKKGYESLYNVFVMDETHTILSCCAGAVTKLKDNKNDYLERIFNFKYPYEYISRFDELIERKSQIMRFYEQLYS
jgi:oxygen-independent coproporphyrinogen-3 oxidase